MKDMKMAALTVFASTSIMFAAIASAADDYSASLCQQAVKAQVNLEHDKANVNFGDDKVNVTSRGASQVEVTGKGNFVRKDGTKKHFKYNCTVDTSAGRVVNATFDKVD
jgi:hypothetical protein